MEGAIMSPRTACIIVGILAATGIGGAQQGTARGEWTRYGGDPGSTKYAPLDQIAKSNVSQLRIAWRRPAVDPSISSRVPGFSYSNNFRSTPLMIDGVLYSPNGIGLVEAFHPATGKTIWVQQPFADEPAQGLRGDSTRGVTYWTDGHGTPPLCSAR
jgi:quinoprotein glucose dehydrogenase